jgi:enamine deaminase RidA (YjgF/YER057c/UK114 family)
VAEVIQPAGLWDPRPRFGQVLKTGGQVFIAGQSAMDENGDTVGVGDPEAQVHQVFSNLEKALASVGAGFDDVVQLNVFCVDIDSVLATIEEEKYKRFSQPVPSTTVQVARLVRPEWLLEIEVRVVMPG